MLIEKYRIFLLNIEKYSVQSQQKERLPKIAVGTSVEALKY